MTSERHAAFTAARDHINGIATAKLFAPEREMLDNAAEDLLLARSIAEAKAAHDTAMSVLDTLVGSGRWTVRMHEDVLALLDACGPQQQLIGA